MQVEIWDFSSVFCRIGEVDACLEGEGSFAGAQDFEVIDFRFKIRETSTCRDRYNLVSFGAVELNKVNGALTFHRYDALCGQIFDDEFAQNGGDLYIDEGNNLKLNGVTKQYRL